MGIGSQHHQAIFTYGSKASESITDESCEQPGVSMKRIKQYEAISHRSFSLNCRA